MTSPPDRRGGYQKPGNPAPVSGPGALSRRTDGGPGGKQPISTPTGLPYGQAGELADAQREAPMGASPGGGEAAPAIDIGSMTGFGEPTNNPEQPVTAGAALGAGPGTEALNLTPQQDQDMQRLLTWLPALERMANVPGASKATRNLVRFLKSQA